jgi:hypothetical protein
MMAGGGLDNEAAVQGCRRIGNDNDGGAIAPMCRKCHVDIFGAVERARHD